MSEWSSDEQQFADQYREYLLGQHADATAEQIENAVEAQVTQMRDMAIAREAGMRVVTTPELQRIIYRADERDYNRQLREDYVPRLDPQGFHILSPMMLHRFIAGEPTDDVHMRVMAHLKLRGVSAEEGATEVVLDIPMEYFNQAGTADAWYEAQGLPTPEQAQDAWDEQVARFWQSVGREPTDLALAGQGA